MKIRQDKYTCWFGSALILQHLKSLLGEVEGVLRGEDIEYIHRMRVATRRLRAAIPLFETCYPKKKVIRWQKSIRKITRALGSARDRDVQLLSVNNFLTGLKDSNLQMGVKRLVLRLSQSRELLQYDIIRKVNDFHASRVSAEILEALAPPADMPSNEPPYTHLLYKNSGRAIHGSLRQFLNHEKFIFDPSNVEELHKMRISAKNFRYIMEVFSPIYGDGLKEFIQFVKKSQDTLGEIHDCDVWLTFIPDFIEEEREIIVKYCGSEEPLRDYLLGINSFGENRLAEREKLYQKYLEDWSIIRTSGLWERLIETIDRPVQKFGSLYPPLRDYNYPDAKCHEDITKNEPKIDG